MANTCSIVDARDGKVGIPVRIVVIGKDGSIRRRKTDAQQCLSPVNLTGINWIFCGLEPVNLHEA